MAKVVQASGELGLVSMPFEDLKERCFSRGAFVRGENEVDSGVVADGGGSGSGSGSDGDVLNPAKRGGAGLKWNDGCESPVPSTAGTSSSSGEGAPNSMRIGAPLFVGGGSRQGRVSSCCFVVPLVLFTRPLAIL